LIQPILEHLIRNRPQLRKLTLNYGRESAIQGQFMLTAAENPFIEELKLFCCHGLQTSHLDRFFRLNRNIRDWNFFGAISWSVGVNAIPLVLRTMIPSMF